MGPSGGAVCKLPGRATADLQCGERRTETDLGATQVVVSVVHRNWSRKTLNREYWVRTVVEQRCSAAALRALGFTNEADWYDARDRTAAESTDLRTLPLRTRRPLLWSREMRHKPPEFLHAASALGQEIEAIVGWEGVRRLALARTWDEWLEDLSDGQRQDIATWIGR